VCWGSTILNVTTGFSFEVVDAFDYDALRPNYSPEAVAWVAERGHLGKGSCVVDLAAGTGQLSKRFAAHGVTLVAVEPARNMRSVIEERLPTVRVLEGSAEAIPLPDGAADAVVVGNAFHHFNEGPAFEEIRRVLRLGGVLAIFWARSADQEAARYPGLQELEDVVNDVVKGVPAAEEIAIAYRKWVTRPPRVHGFSAFERREFPTTHVVPSARLADLYATSSNVASLPPAVRADLLLRIRQISPDFPQVLESPARSVVDVCIRE
jgi:SAM-dependent methyltransferase